MKRTVGLLILFLFMGNLHAQPKMQDIRNIVNVHTNNPKRGIDIFDSLRNVKFADEFILDMAQSEMYAELAMYPLSIEYGRRALVSDSVKANFAYKVTQVSTLIDAYMFINDYPNALTLIYDILTNKSSLPKARAIRVEANMIFALGTINHKMGQKKVAQDYFDQSSERLENSQNTGELALYSFFLGQMTTIAIDDQDLDKAMIICKKREQIIEKIDMLKSSPVGYTAQQYAYLFSKTAYICQRRGDEIEAKKYHDKFMATSASKRVYEGSFIAPYYINSNQPDLALRYLLPVLSDLQKQDTINLNYRGTLSSIEECYSMLGEYKTALNYKNRELSVTDSLVNREKYRQTIQMNILYETEQRKTVIAMQNGEIATQQLWMAIIGISFLSTVSFLIILLINYRRKQTRNQKRYREIMNGNYMRNKENPDEQVDKLFVNLEKLMCAEKLYLKPNLERDALCLALATNVTYLASAIKEKTGLTIMGYINKARLDCAKKLIVESTKLDIEQVAIDSGFGSSRTLYRQFKAAFDMTPLDFFKLSIKLKP